MIYQADSIYTLADLEKHCLADVRYAADAERCAAYRSLQASVEQPDRGDAWLEEKRDPYGEAHEL